MDIILVGAKNHPQTNEIIGCIKTRVILIQNIESAMSIIPRLLLNRNTLPAIMARGFRASMGLSFNINFQSGLKFHSEGTRSIASTSKIKSRLTAALVISSFESRPADLVTTVTDHPERTGRYHPYVSESLLRDIRSNHTVLGCLPLLFPQCCR